MPWPLREISGFDELNLIIDSDGAKASIGCFFRQRYEIDGAISNLVLVILPPGGYEGQWVPNLRAGAGGPKWNISGEWPNVTISPSIKFLTEGGYHGWIQNGIITDDCDGRRF